MFKPRKPFEYPSLQNGDFLLIRVFLVTVDHSLSIYLANSYLYQSPHVDFLNRAFNTNSVTKQPIRVSTQISHQPVRMLRNAPPSCFTSVLVNMSATKSTSRTSLPSENAMSLVAAPTSTSIHSLDKIVQNEKKQNQNQLQRVYSMCVSNLFIGRLIHLFLNYKMSSIFLF